MRRLKSATAAAALAGLVGLGVARAEGTTIFIPFFTTSAVYDDNVFSSSSQPEKDFFVRDTPGLQWTFRRHDLTIEGRYRVDAEFYEDHNELNTYHARQVASVNMQRFQDRFTTFSGGVTFAETQRAGDLVQTTGLDLGRVRSQAYTAGVGLERRTGPSETRGLTYDYTLLIFGQEGNVDSHLLSASWARDITPFTSVAVRAGPLFIQGNVYPDLSVSVDRRLRRGDLGISYLHSHTPLPDVAVKTDAVIVTASRQISRSLRIAASPAFLKNRRGDATASVTRLSLSVDFQMTPWLSLQVSDRFSAQEGSTGSVLADQSIRHNVLLISANMATQFRPQSYKREPQPGEDQ